jgi:hypothetical protein
MSLTNTNSLVRSGYSKLIMHLLKFTLKQWILDLLVLQMVVLKYETIVFKHFIHKTVDVYLCVIVSVSVSVCVFVEIKCVKY